MQNVAKFNELVADYQSARALAAEAKAEQDRIAGLLKEIMEAEGLTEYHAATGKVIYREVVSRPIDSRALKAERPEIADRYTVERVTRPLKVS